MAALTCVVLTKVVDRGLLFHCTTEPETKLDPLTVKVNPESPTLAVVVDRAAIAGKGLLTENVVRFELPPPGAGFDTDTFAVEPVATSTAGIAAVS